MDDKIINRANEQGRTAEEVATEFSNKFIGVMRAANVLDPDVRPRATKEIGAMIGMIKTLIEGGHAYAADNGDVYFAVRSDPSYGEVSGRNIDDLMVGARIEENEDKRDPLDFALWKAAKPGEPSLEEPLGRGGAPDGTPSVPPWSTATWAPRSTSTAAAPTSPSRTMRTSAPRPPAPGTRVITWMHTGMLLVDGEKMSKSLGNFFTLAEVLEKHSAAGPAPAYAADPLPQPARLFLGAPRGAPRTRSRASPARCRNLKWAADHVEGEPSAELTEVLTAAMEKAAADYEACMDDDFNTAGAVAAYFQLVTEANKYLEQAAGAVDRGAARACAAVIAGALAQLGVELPVIEEPLPVGLLGVAAGLTGYTGDDIDEAAEKILEARAAARVAKDWGTADAIRDQLRDMGLAIEDTASGSRITPQNGDRH